MWDWQVRTSRPRIWLDEGRIRWLREKVKGKSADEIKTLAGPSTEGLALAYVITGDQASGRAAIDKAFADRQAMRATGATPRAITYDWCYPLFTSAERSRMGAMLVSDARKEMSNRRMWRSFSNTLYTHAAELGLAAIAICHEDRAGEESLRFLAEELNDAMRMFEDLFADGEWPEGFDYNRISTYLAFRLFWAVKTASGVDVMASSAHMRNTTQYVIYGSKPDVLVYPGDDIDYPFQSDRDREALLLAAAEYDDQYAQYFLNHCPGRLFQPTRYNRWRDLLWYAPDRGERSFADLPKSRIFRGEGLVLARSGWEWDTQTVRAPVSWVSFRCGRFFGEHSHLDNGHFDIYYRGELALDSGRLDDDWGMERSGDSVRRSQFFNYYRRAIAHNTVLVMDPDEEMEMGVLNDGGQKEMLYAGGMRNVPEDYDQGTHPSEAGLGACDWVKNPGRWDTGEMLAYAGNRFLTYACGDATKAYSERKIARFVRQFLFIQPNLVIVFDRVVSTNPEFRKTWLLHSVKEPRLHGPDGPFEFSYGVGRLVCVPVLPERRSLKKVGGPSYEFYVGGVQYACGPNASSGRKSELHYGEIPGAWRVEESPAVSASEDYFLNVMLATDKGSMAVPSARLESPGDDSNITLTLGLLEGRSVTASFAKGDIPSAKVAIAEGGRTVFDGLMPNEIVLEEGRVQ